MAVSFASDKFDKMSHNITYICDRATRWTETMLTKSKLDDFLEKLNA